MEADRYRSLLNQAERMRLGLLTLARLRVRIGREKEHGEEPAAIDRFFELCSQLLAAIGQSMRSSDPIGHASETLDKMEVFADVLRLSPARSDVVSALVSDALRQMDALTGQLRSSLELASHATPAGLAEFESDAIANPLVAAAARQPGDPARESNL